MRAGDGRVNHRIREWMRIGRGAFETPAASGQVEEIKTFPTWLQVDIYLRPFYPSQASAEANGDRFEDPLAELYVRLAEHFRSVVIPQQGEKWRAELPRIPLTTEELKKVLQHHEDEDERRALRRLAEEGSTSAAIMDFLGLTREIAREAFEMLKGERRLQVNLARILGASRYKVLTQNKVYHVKCPRKTCYEKDSFQHMLHCYHLTELVVTGPDVVPFLVQMAKVTLIPEGTKLIPYMVEYNPGEGVPDLEGGTGETGENGEIEEDEEIGT